MPQLGVPTAPAVLPGDTPVPLAAEWRPVPLPQDFEYVPPDDVLDKDLQCSVCLGWPVDPVILGCPGGHMLCRRCVSGPLCPLDRQPYARFSAPQRPILTLLNRLRVFCPKAAEGCPWTGPRGNVLDHWAKCSFAEQECAQCGLRVKASDPEFAMHAHEPAAAGRFASNVQDPLDTVPTLASTADSATRRMEAISRVIEVYEQAERLNVCFVVDCTGSMGGHISAVKNQIQWIVHELRARLPSMHLHLGFVGYRDHCDAQRIEVLPFTTSVDEFRMFVAGLRATGGGGDGPEDVHGGLERALEQEWSIGGAATRVLIHIADYPAHGRQYNDCPGDSYPAGDPRGLNLEHMMLRFKDLSVQYIFGHITQHTEKMVRVLNEALDDYIDSKDMRNVELMAEVVTSSLHTSVASTVSTLTSSPEAGVPPVVLSDEVPEWQSVTPDAVLLRECCRVQELASLCVGADPSLTRQVQERPALVALAALPFSQGETRVARHALLDGAPAVAKHFKLPSDEDGDEAAGAGAPAPDAQLALSEVSAVAGFLAEAFSASRPEGERVAFLASAVAQGENVVPFNLEDALPSVEFRRFSNNIGWWELDVPRTLMDFTRFSHEATNGHMMVVDLQGVKTQDGWLLTDPCILCEDVERFGSGNLGPHAMDRCLSALRVRLDEAPVPFEPAPAQGGGRSAAPAAPRVAADPWRPPNAPALKPESVNLQLDSVIDMLLASKTKPGQLVKVPEDQVKALIRVARDTFMRQPTLLELQAPVNVVGDIHGQYHDLLRLFDAGGFPPDSNYLMLGDYVDRGKQSIETICLLLAYKVKYPENFFLLRGNHECASITRIYGFYDECKRRYNIKLWKGFIDVFNCLPPAAVIDERIFCVHGGPSPEIRDFNDIKNLPRPCDVPDTGLLCDLLWADPDQDMRGWAENDRGVSFCFGPDVLDQLLPRLGLDLIARAHQVVEDGYEFFARRQLVTIFSAPDYCGEFDNAAALMEVREDLGCSFKLVKSLKKWRK